MGLLGPQVSLFPDTVAGGLCVLLGTIQFLRWPPMHSLALDGCGITFQPLGKQSLHSQSYTLVLTGLRTTDLA